MWTCKEKHLEHAGQSFSIEDNGEFFFLRDEKFDGIQTTEIIIR